MSILRQTQSKMKPAYQLINNHLSNRLKQFDQLSTSIQMILAIPDVNRIWPIVRHRTLLLMTDDVMVAHHARFMQKALCSQLNRRFGLQLLSVNIKLISLSLASTKPKPKRKKISTQTADILKSIALDIQDDTLKQALCRMADAAKHP